ncbi:MAG: DUF4418 family protein [Methanomicrobiales archaeon]|nr:DUF4418 family protein [Methanomicrobiales archaeon]
MKNITPSVLLCVLGVALLAAPWTFAPVCEVHGDFVQTVTGKQLPMPCGYTARAEIGVGALVMVTGVVLGITKSSEARRMLGFMGIALGALAIAFPVSIIGMCAKADHTCRTMTQPTITLISLGIIVVAGIVLYYHRK